jgi:septal ring factor EnvC (AmiA/AmiB activator)
MELIEELNALQQTTADERESLGKVLNQQQQELNWTRNELRDATLMLESYEKTILVLTKRLTEARKALNTPAPTA